MRILLTKSLENRRTFLACGDYGGCMTLNCWDFIKCERQPGGRKARELGVCPASIDDQHHGKNNGINAGRYCWVISGTLCDNEAQGSFALKIAKCLDCEFYRLVRNEEGGNFQPYATPETSADAVDEDISA